MQGPADIPGAQSLLNSGGSDCLIPVASSGGNLCMRRDLRACFCSDTPMELCPLLTDEPNSRAEYRPSS